MSDYDFKADRKEKLERRLATARRVAALPVDPLTKERVHGFLQELEVELGKGSAGIEAMVSRMDLSDNAVFPLPIPRHRAERNRTSARSRIPHLAMHLVRPCVRRAGAVRSDEVHNFGVEITPGEEFRLKLLF